MTTLICSNRPFPDRDAEDLEGLQRILDNGLNPDYIFFPYWSWKVPKDIVEKYECYGFHTGNIRGGSPIQNSIRRSELNTYVVMFRMDKDIDKGVIINSESIHLYGSLEEIVIRQTKIIQEMIHEFLATHK